MRKCNNVGQDGQGDKVLTCRVGQVESFALLEGRHLVEGVAVLGMLEAAEMDALAVDDHVRELFGQFDF